ncbi:hypothetical protein POM88_028701 [Heracleum sosnowskyi]|uniref:Beta-galactosidase n=1 Tax=Heracleum sosnowskyi TaxID=360622 RepID=A0AAD8HUF5_9APIA|nr:hypothetical protein POM88_028701 [Heracleum sosnowskyi]
MPRPLPKPYECVRRAWHSENHSTDFQVCDFLDFLEIYVFLLMPTMCLIRVLNVKHYVGTKGNREWQEKLPIVVFKAEEIMYSEATSEIVSQRNLEFTPNSGLSELTIPSSAWSWYEEKVGVDGKNSFTTSSLLEQINTTKDTSDFLWYTTSVNVTEDARHGETLDALLVIEILGHETFVFVNKKPVGFSFGNHDFASFILSKTVSLNTGTNTIDILSMMIGLHNYWFDFNVTLHLASVSQFICNSLS